MKIEIVDLKKRFQEEKHEIFRCINRVLKKGHFILMNLKENKIQHKKKQKQTIHLNKEYNNEYNNESIYICGCVKNCELEVFLSSTFLDLTSSKSKSVISILPFEFVAILSYRF